MKRVSVIIFRLFYTPITLGLTFHGPILTSSLVHVPFSRLNILVGTHFGLYFYFGRSFRRTNLKQLHSRSILSEINSQNDHKNIILYLL